MIKLQNLSTQNNNVTVALPLLPPPQKTKYSLRVFVLANFIFIFWKAKTCQLQLWFWSKTKLYRKYYKDPIKPNNKQEIALMLLLM